MQAANAVSAEGQVWYQLFEALQYVTNPYALLGFIFLVIIIAISFARISPTLRGLSLAALGPITLLCVYLLLSSSLSVVEKRSLVHLVQADGANSAEIAPGVTVEMVDTTSLEGKVKPGKPWSGWTRNRDLPFYVVRCTLEKAGVPALSKDEFVRMGQAGWDSYLASLGGELADKVKDRPFTHLKVSVGGEVVSDRWWFKGEVVPVEVAGAKLTSFKIQNIYNTKNLTSGEPEAINLQVVQAPSGKPCN
jgi:hypothetical protein